MSAEPIWFLATLMEIHYPADGAQPALIEVTAPAGDMPPLHVHEDEAEAFYVLEGELEVWVGGDTHLALGIGEAVRAPAGIPHSYRAGEDGARFLVSAGARMERFIRAMGQPAPERVLPTPAPPDPEVLGPLAAAAGITLLGPPGALPIAETPMPVSA
jgi:quercetin dioxygenase-like cupin family protein